MVDVYWIQDKRIVILLKLNLPKKIVFSVYVQCAYVHPYNALSSTSKSWNKLCFKFYVWEYRFYSSVPTTYYIHTIVYTAILPQSASVFLVWWKIKSKIDQRKSVLFRLFQHLFRWAALLQRYTHIHIRQDVLAASVLEKSTSFFHSIIVTFSQSLFYTNNAILALNELLYYVEKISNFAYL